MTNHRKEKDRVNYLIDSQKQYLHLRYKIERFKLKRRTPPKKILSQAFMIGLFVDLPMNDIEDL
jgi:hypothetical protein